MEDLLSKLRELCIQQEAQLEEAELQIAQIKSLITNTQ